jgi:hypothetical protein
MNNLSLKSLTPIVSAVAGMLRTYAGFFLFLLFAAIYGFLVLQINEYSDPKIDTSEVISKITASPTSGIDEDAAKKLLELEDNSVNVQTLFRVGRTNPFQE